MGPVLSHAEAGVPNAETGLPRERCNFQKEPGADGSGGGRDGPAERRRSRPVLTRHLFGILTKALLRFLAGPELPLRCQHYCFPGISCFFKVFLPKCDVLQAPQPISLLLHQTDETIHLPAPRSLAPPYPSLPSSPQDLAETQESRRQKTDPTVSTRGGDMEGLRYSQCPVKTTGCRQILPRGINLFKAAP